MGSVLCRWQEVRTDGYAIMIYPLAGKNYRDCSGGLDGGLNPNLGDSSGRISGAVLASEPLITAHNNSDRLDGLLEKSNLGSGAKAEASGSRIGSSSI